MRSSTGAAQPGSPSPTRPAAYVASALIPGSWANPHPHDYSLQALPGIVEHLARRVFDTTVEVFMFIPNRVRGLASGMLWRRLGAWRRQTDQAKIASRAMPSTISRRLMRGRI